MTGSIEFDHDDGAARLTLSNPGKRNAISADMWRELLRVAGEVADDPAIRCVIVEGADGTFSAGADIAGFDTGRSGSGAGAYDDLLEDALAALEAMPKPVIAAVAGPCMGAGAALAAACDFRVAEEAAFFAVPPARLGIGYDPRGVARLVRVFGDAATRELLFLGERMTADRAHQIGAVHKLATQGEVRLAADALAGIIAARAPLTIAAAKAALSEIAGRYRPSEEILRFAEIANQSADYAEGRAAFAEKRPPRFVGK
ncbi:enoyl-CoA hydratase/isomerase family protein [Amorphus sp. 3PC139-8]|uniref:enoyl-CoA hydratase/isomerase family protein n=1 Tax=Amorphus sp. 3PC139-8 TaxID=2735676 RepID=UPI00345D0E7F